MAQAQKSYFVFRRKGRVNLNQRWASVQSTTGSRCVRISGSNAWYTMFRGSVKGTGFPLHSPFSPSLPLPCVTVCHYISTGVYRYKGNGSLCMPWQRNGEWNYLQINSWPVSSPSRINPEANSHGSHWIRGWVGSGDSGSFEEEKVSCFCSESNYNPSDLQPLA